MAGAGWSNREGVPDLYAMTPQERAEWLAGRRARSPRRALLPVCVAVVAGVMWALVLSPLVGAPWGADLSPAVVDSGTATVSSPAACERGWNTLWRMHTCAATIVWDEHGTTTDLPVRSPQALAPGTYEVVARHPFLRDRPYEVDSFDLMRVVPADMPANEGPQRTKQMALDIGAAVVIAVPTLTAIHLRTRPVRRR